MRKSLDTAIARPPKKEKKEQQDENNHDHESIPSFKARVDRWGAESITARLVAKNYFAAGSPSS